MVYPPPKYPEKFEVHFSTSNALMCCYKDLLTTISSKKRYSEIEKKIFLFVIERNISKFKNIFYESARGEVNKIFCFVECGFLLM